MINTDTINVLYVDDEPGNLTAFTASFRRHFTVFTAISADAANVILAENDIHILITDQRMPDKTGTELLAETVKKYPDQVRILLTGYTDVEALEDAINVGHIYKYLKKPWNDVLLKASIEEAFSIFDLRRREKELLKQLREKGN